MTKVKYFLKGFFVTASIFIMLGEAFIATLFFTAWRDEKEEYTELKEKMKIKYRA